MADYNQCLSVPEAIRRLRALDEEQLLWIEEPTLAELLEVDEEYRYAAAADKLKKIAPRRFNPAGEAWLPVLHTTRSGRHG